MSTSPSGPAALSANADVFTSGLTNPRGLTFGPDGTLDALEMSAATMGPSPIVPNSGRVVSVCTYGEVTPVATGFNFPTGMTLGPDGRLYVSNGGLGAPRGSGQIVVINLPGSSS